MSALLPVALYGLEVPAGGIFVPAAFEFPATIRITMAALDPTAEPEADADGNIPAIPRTTLKIIKATSEDNGSESDDDDDALERLLSGADDSDDSEEEDEANGGPSDPSKSKKARQAAAIKKLLAATQEASDDEMEDVDAKPKKGKAKASEEVSDEESEEESEDGDDLEFEDYVVCTLDTERNFQQAIDITIQENEQIFFVVTGTHAVYLTGNYVITGDEEDSDEDDSDDEDYDLPPGLEDMDDSELSDELDKIEGVARIKEIDTDEEEAPKLVSAKKSKKRPAEEEAEGLDEMISQDGKKLSKKQLKKLKTAEGKAAAVESAAKGSPASAKSDKKVQFAKELEQGPTGPAKQQADKAAEKAGKTDKTDKTEKADKAAPAVKVIQGVTIDDRKVGAGRTVKSGDKVGMRYIGKLTNGKVFDANKKGAPFTFKVGKGEVIKGWDIGIVGMSVGGERRLTIPAQHAYGNKSLPGIPANSTLVFDVKLLEIK
ncbi:hypothetical protein B0T25DRAFT_557505 [Lasiosphaeria hispida]|uniref:FK506-binding protein n=1 Tax=Lasiosphaeria hispida TaxID=260671 RepID=A0AAJ0M816_9PEZI|nr:hypothetical protein B0T25DRAFT_557505 [Lasiosphaeria hispida]